MNHVPPGQPPSDDVDSFYRRTSALDPGRPSERTREAVLAHARRVAAANSRTTTELKRRERRWRPAIFGMLAAAALAGLVVLPQILTPRVAPRTTEASAQLSDAAASAAPTPQALVPPAAGLTMSPLDPPPPLAPPSAKAATTKAVEEEPTPATPASATSVPPTSATRPTAKRSPTPSLARAKEYVAPTRERGAADRREAKANTASPANARAESPAGVSGGAAESDQPAQPELDSITVAAERQSRAASDAATASPMVAIATAASPQALRLAAETGDLKRLQRILDQSTDVNSRDDAGRTALLLATLNGQTEAVKLLLAHGANPNTADAQGATPLSAALAGNHSTIIRMLEHAGAH